MQLRCCEVACRETTCSIYFSTWFHNNQKEILNRKVEGRLSDPLIHCHTWNTNPYLCTGQWLPFFSWLKCFITLFFMSLTLSCHRKMQDFNSYSAQYMGIKKKKKDFFPGGMGEWVSGWGSSLAWCTLLPHMGWLGWHLGTAALGGRGGPAALGRSGGSSGGSEG